MTLQNQLFDWAEKTVAAYDHLAREDKSCNKAFHTQSNLSQLTQSPKLLILGVNPYGNCKYDYPTDDNGYKGQIQNENWQIPNGMTAEKLLEGNPFERDKTKWRIWKPVDILFKMSGIEYLLEEGNYAYSNMILYETRKETDIPAKVWDELLPYTFEFIDILKPRYIFCLGIKNSFDRLVGKNSCENIIANKLWIGNYDQSIVFGLPHPSYGAWNKHYEALSTEIQKVITTAK